MIDATSFASSYNAFWNDCTPTCEHFVRRLNLNGLDRFVPPMNKSGTLRRALIAEYAFSLFVEHKKISETSRIKNKEASDAAWAETERRLSSYAAQGLEINRDFTREEKVEIVELTNRLFHFFSHDDIHTLLRPTFLGCGYVDASEGDVIFGDIIYEVKTVERQFRSVDIRQVITYAAMNSASMQFDIKKVGLINPRSGQFFNISTDGICMEISGRPAQSLFSLIIQTISSGETSR